MIITTNENTMEATLTLFTKDYSNTSLLLKDIEYVRKRTRKSLVEKINEELNEDGFEIDFENSTWENTKQQQDLYVFIFSIKYSSEYATVDEMDDDMLNMMYPNREDEDDY